MKRDGVLAKILFLPISKIYGMCVGIRNLMFNMHILKEKEAPVPVIVVGNLAAGGTGKTPHVEYIVEKLRHSYHMAVLSRGYKRLTSGFVMATKRSTPKEIGDEPYQIYNKFDCQVPVAVCEDRVAGINELLSIDPQIDLVLLDDAFQHRYIKPTVSILLTEYNRPVFKDSLLPYGNLRERKRSMHRADIIVASKCPEKITALDYTLFEQNLNMMPYQKLFFSRFAYSKLVPVFPEQAGPVAPALDWLEDGDMLLTVAGIGNPRPFVRYVKHFRPKVLVNIFPDHHNFTKKDMQLIKQRFNSMEGYRNYLITTEKDAVRMANCPYFPHELKAYTYYLPIKVEFMRDGADNFIETIRKIIKERKIQTK